MASITSLNRNRRFNDPGDFCEAAFNTFLPIYEWHERAHRLPTDFSDAGATHCKQFALRH
jgi:hypothetical protein